MSMFDWLLTSSTLLCALVSGFVFSFAVIVMPGIKSLNERAYLQSFKAMDAIIQGSHPLFVLMWLGSIVTLLAATVMSFSQLEGLNRILILTAAFIYMFGVQLPTFTINIPLNNRLKEVDLAQADQETIDDLVKQFDTRWIPSNTFRTIISVMTTGLLLMVLRNT